MSEISETLQAGLEHHRAGRFPEAEKAYRRVLELYPRHAGAVHLLGLIAFQVGKTELAAQCVEQAIKLDAFRATYPADLGEIYRALGKIPEAIASYRKALELNPQLADAQTRLGRLLEAAGKADEALECYRRALAIDPDCAEAHLALATTMLSRQQIADAQASLEKAAHLAPDSAEVYFKLGECLLAQDRQLDAIACYQKAAKLQPTSPLVHCQLGLIYLERGQLPQAATHYRKAVALAPHLAEAHYNLGIVRRRRGRPRLAVESFTNAVRHRSDYFAAYLNLSTLHAALVQPDMAVDAARRATALRPESAAAALHLARSLQLQADTPAAIAAFRRAVELDPADGQAHSELLGALAADPSLDAVALVAEHRAWAARHAEPLTAAVRPHAVDRAPKRRLRLGYVSSHFRQHTLAAFIEPLLAAHDRERFEIFCYADTETVDEGTARLQRLAHTWRSIAPLADREAAELVASDNIDILVDLAGHLGNRLGIFARKPAPIQVAYLGYPHTTGMSAIDYRLTDAYADPPGTTDSFYTEKLVRLPRAFFCYRPPEAAPELNRPPVEDAGHVTLGWLNGTLRTTPQAVELWARLLAAVPEARLLVLAYRPGAFEERVREAMSRHGVEQARVEIVGEVAPDQVLRLYHRVDLALDSFPLGGNATVCQALWMGVPVVVRRGTATGFGASALATLDLGAFLSRSDDEYVRVVTQLAGDRARLAELRACLRARMSESPLVDAASCARDVENAYQQMWSARCGRA
jgi:predicted O-linked N-acetylglucosamine transferase (SPINDLY family)